MRISRLTKPAAAIAFFAMVSPLIASPISASASGATCGTYCSGADLNSTANVGGNGPQTYIGEVSTGAFAANGTQGPCPADYQGMCFNATGAAGAETRFNAGTGLGIAYDFTFYGPNYTGVPAGMDAYCWGQYQARSAVIMAYDHWNKYLTYPIDSIMVGDIESENSDGWVAGNYSANRLAFNGFSNYVAGRASADSSCNNTNGVWDFQYMLYANSYVWYELAGAGGQGSIANTPVWTDEPYDYSSTTLPASFNPAVTWTYGSGYPEWSAYSNYLENWQFWQGSSADYDEGLNSWYMPLYGFDWG